MPSLCTKAHDAKFQTRQDEIEGDTTEKHCSEESGRLLDYWDLLCHSMRSEMPSGPRIGAAMTTG